MFLKVNERFEGIIIYLISMLAKGTNDMYFLIRAMIKIPDTQNGVKVRRKSNPNLR